MLMGTSLRTIQMPTINITPPFSLPAIPVSAKAALAAAQSISNTTVSDAVANVSSAIDSAISSGIDGALSQVGGLVDGVVGDAMAKVDQAMALVDTVGGMLGDITGTIDGLTGEAQSLLNLASDPLGQLGGMVETNFDAAKSVIQSAIANANSLANMDRVKDAIAAPMNLAQNLVDKASDTAFSIMDFNVGQIPDISKLVEEQLKDLGGLVSGLGVALPPSIPSMGNLMGEAKSAMATAGRSVLSSIPGLPHIGGL